MRPLRHSLLALVCLAGAAGVPAGEPVIEGPPYDPAAWLADLEEARVAFATKYADLEWDVLVRKVDLTAAFSETRRRVLAAHSATEAMAAFDDLAARFGDRHVRFQWRQAEGAGGLSCRSLGYNEQMQGPLLAALIPGYVALQPPPSDRFPAGIVTAGSRRVVIVKVPLFSPHGFPDLCGMAIAALGLERGQACDAGCADRIEDWASDRLTRDFVATLQTVASTGADALLIDIAGNGGGSQWTEAAARMVSGRRLQAAAMYFVRGEHWTRRLAQKEAALRAAAASAPGEEGRWLARLADLVEERRQEAATPCDGVPLWRGQAPACAWLGGAFYATGLLPSADSAVLRPKPWAALVFTPMQYPYEDGLWRGPLVVLVDGGTGSAAAQFAAELQDNHAAVVFGSHSGGAGCGYTDGGTPTVLTNSRGVLRLPDCVRLRSNGTNAALGVQPDVPVALRAAAPAASNARQLGAHLAEAVALAQHRQEALKPAGQ
jgi:hypothetical protein